MERPGIDPPTRRGCLVLLIAVPLTWTLVLLLAYTIYRLIP